ncbi:plasminogen-like [Argopecten irradians]|uniref:plasminogen-like n=1 Tax=Argopecten irradians TaxID=31199 RepID=UPI0037244A77
MWNLHNHCIISICFTCVFNTVISTSTSTQCLTKVEAFERNQIVDTDVARVLEPYTPITCMRECITFSLCTSINFYTDSLRCELILTDITSRVLSVNGMTIYAQDIPQEYTGECYGHTCNIFEKCAGKLSTGEHACVQFDFCDEPPPPVANTLYTIDTSAGIASAMFSCVDMSIYTEGSLESNCNPYTRTWTVPGIVCTPDLPAACGTPPPLPGSSPATYPLNGNQLRGSYACSALSGGTSVEFCPVTTCTGINEWTNATLSCSVNDCYGNGVYEGKVACTVNGHTCQRWDSKSPHFHLYSDLESSENYCRIKDSSKPWCYTIYSSPRWEYCGVPAC